MTSWNWLRTSRAALEVISFGGSVWGICDKSSHLVQAVPVLRVVRIAEYRYDAVQAGDAAKQTASTSHFELAAVLDPDGNPGCGYPSPASPGRSQPGPRHPIWEERATS